MDPRVPAYMHMHYAHTHAHAHAHVYVHAHVTCACACTGASPNPNPNQVRALGAHGPRGLPMLQAACRQLDARAGVPVCVHVHGNMHVREHGHVHG